MISTTSTIYNYTKMMMMSTRNAKNLRKGIKQRTVAFFSPNKIAISSHLFLPFLALDILAKINWMRRLKPLPMSSGERCSFENFENEIPVEGDLVPRKGVVSLLAEIKQVFSELLWLLSTWLIQFSDMEGCVIRMEKLRSYFPRHFET